MAGGQLPTNRNAKLPPEYVESLGTTLDELKTHLYVPDWKQVSARHEERINKVEQLLANAGKAPK